MTPFETELTQATRKGQPHLEKREGCLPNSWHDWLRRETRLNEEGRAKAMNKLSAIRKSMLLAATRGETNIWVPFGWEFTLLMVQFKWLCTRAYAQGFQDALKQTLLAEAPGIHMELNRFGLTLDFGDYFNADVPRLAAPHPTESDIPTTVPLS